jgi:hypothetical protein
LKYQAGLAAEPSENTVRDALRREVRTRSTEALLDEFWVPGSNERADLVVIGERLDGFEIKTAHDTLARLPRQVSAYGRLFERCNVVVAERHARRSSEMVPSWWGVAVFTSSGKALSFRWIRDAQPNAGFDCGTLVRLLWRDEARSILCELGAPPDGTRSRASMWSEILALTDPSRLGSLVRRALVSREPSSARIPTRRYLQHQAS